MDGVLVAVGAEFLQLHAAGIVPPIFLGGVPRDARRSLVGIRAALGTFQGDDNTNALCHDLETLKKTNTIAYFCTDRRKEATNRRTFKSSE